MARPIKIVCPTCGHEWTEDLDDHQAERTIFRGPRPQTRTETYRFKCPQDGTYVIVDVEIEE
jgi:predicted RNA-binding Zn-ribbon protein involved in translation (DUF1610 family)